MQSIYLREEFKRGQFFKIIDTKEWGHVKKQLIYKQYSATELIGTELIPWKLLEDFMWETNSHSIVSIFNFKISSIGSPSK